jgi:hypothetical protein
MKKLFIISEDERKRILSLHENASKRQYLGEAKVTGDEYSGRNIKFDSEDPITQSIFNLVYNVSDIDETKLVNEILKIKDKNTFVKINNELMNVFKMMGSKYIGLDSIIADAMDYDYDQYDTYKVLEPHLKKLGINTDRLGHDDYVFKNLPTNTGNAVADEDKKSGWEKYPCVTKIGKPYKMKDGSTRYAIGGVFYYSNGRKVTQDGKMTSYDCSSSEFVTKKQRVVPETSEDLLQGKGYLTLNDSNSLVKQVQNNLISADESVTPTGTFDKATYDAVKSFQSKNGLKSDGIVGKKTWSILSNVKPETMTPKEIDRIS